MSSTQLMASKTSSLCAALEQHSDLKQYKVGMAQSSSPSVVREVIEIQNSSGSLEIASAGSAEFIIPKAGIIRGCHLKISLSGGASDTKAIAWSKAPLASAIVSEVSLRTQSRTLLQIDSYMLAQMIEKSPHRNTYKQLMGCGYNDTTATNKPAGIESDLLLLRSDTWDTTLTDRTLDVYLPVLLSPFQNRLNCALDSAFTETMSIVVKTRPLVKYCDRTSSGGTNFDKIKISCVFDCLALGASVRDKVVKSNYVAGKSAQMLFERHNLIAKSETKTPPAKVALTPIDMTINSTDLARSLTFIAVPAANEATPAAKYSNEHHEISRVVLSASGRVLCDYTRESSILMNLGTNTTQAFAPEPSLKTANGVTVDAASVFTTSPETNAFTIKFCMDGDDSSRFTGALALSGCSSVSAKVYVKSRTNAQYRIQCYSTASAVYSVASNSGSVQGSLSI